jgi:hypothetical protein
MDFTAASLHAAITGVACAAPLLVCSLVARSQAFRRRFPVLEQLHVQQAELQRHFTAGAWGGRGNAAAERAPALSSGSLGSLSCTELS